MSPPTSEAPCLYLTFDDGPIPGVTEWVLDQLKAYQAQATFFCVGDNVSKHPQVYRRLLAEGHRVGNHTHNHLNGWKTDDALYWANTQEAQAVMERESKGELPQPLLFRPPYIRMRPSQSRQIRQQYQVVMWDVLSGDFDPQLAPEECLKQVLSHSQAGSIIIFHDSLKAEATLRYVLPRFLTHFAERGFVFKALP